MSKFDSKIARPLAWSTTLLLAAFVTGCGDMDPILGGTADTPAGGVVPVPSAVDLGTASPFGMAATAGVTNTPTNPITHIEGDVILSPLDQCNSVPVDNAGGFGACAGSPPTLNGTVVTDSYPDLGITSSAVKVDMNAAFLAITPPAGPPAAGSLGGATNLPAGTTLGEPTGSALVQGDNLFAPGVYESITSILITDDVTLDGQGDPNAVFIFQSSSTLDLAAGSAPPGPHSRIILINGAKASNVYWQVTSAATFGAYSESQGNVLASGSITMETGATSCGRLFAGAWEGGSGAFVFDSNIVSIPGQPFAPVAGYSATCE